MAATWIASVWKYYKCCAPIWATTHVNCKMISVPVHQRTLLLWTYTVSAHYIRSKSACAKLQLRRQANRCLKWVSVWVRGCRTKCRHKILKNCQRQMTDCRCHCFTNTIETNIYVMNFLANCMHVAARWQRVCVSVFLFNRSMYVKFNDYHYHWWQCGCYRCHRCWHHHNNWARYYIWPRFSIPWQRVFEIQHFKKYSGAKPEFT